MYKVTDYFKVSACEQGLGKQKCSLMFLETSHPSPGGGSVGHAWRSQIPVSPCRTEQAFKQPPFALYLPKLEIWGCKVLFLQFCGT
jgi:hypothetical protein